MKVEFELQESDVELFKKRLNLVIFHDYACFIQTPPTNDVKLTYKSNIRIINCVWKMITGKDHEVIEKIKDGGSQEEIK